MVRNLNIHFSLVVLEDVYDSVLVDKRFDIPDAGRELL